VILPSFPTAPMHVPSLRHVKAEHNLWNYFFFLQHLELKAHDEYTGQESYVHLKVKEKDISFFPMNRALSVIVVGPPPPCRGGRGCLRPILGSALLDQKFPQAAGHKNTTTYPPSNMTHPSAFQTRKGSCLGEDHVWCAPQITKVPHGNTWTKGPPRGSYKTGVISREVGVVHPHRTYRSNFTPPVPPQPDSAPEVGEAMDLDAGEDGDEIQRRLAWIEARMFAETDRVPPRSPWMRLAGS